MFCCNTKSIAPGRHRIACSVAFPIVIVESGVVTATDPAVVNTPVVPSRLALTHFNLALSAAEMST